MPTTYCSAMQFINHQFILHPKCITVLIWCQTSVVKWCFFVIQWSYQFSYQNIRNYIEEAGILCQYLLPIFIGANYLWLISESCPKKFVFSIFFMILYCYNHIFAKLQKNYFKMQIMDNQFILHSKCITILTWCQIFVIKGCFFTKKWFYF